MGCTTGNSANNMYSEWQFSDEAEYYEARNFDNPIVAAQLLGNLGYAKSMPGFEDFASALSAEAKEVETWGLVFDIAPEAGIVSTIAVLNYSRDNGVIWTGSYDDETSHFEYERRALSNPQSREFFEKASELNAHKAVDCVGRESLDARILYLTMFSEGSKRRFSYFAPFSGGAECKFVHDFYKFVEGIKDAVAAK